MNILSTKNIFRLSLILILVANLLFFTNGVLAVGEVYTGLDLAAPADIQGGKQDLTVIAGQFINYVLGIVGTIFLLVVLIGGYKWMTAGGAEEKIADAKKMIVQGINGMIAIFLAYALAYAIIYGLSLAVSSPTTG